MFPILNYLKGVFDMQGMFDVLVPILVKAAEFSFFLGLSITGIRILMRAASGRDNWLK